MLGHLCEALRVKYAGDEIRVYQRYLKYFRYKLDKPYIDWIDASISMMTSS